MQTHISTTPFGRRAISLGQIANQARSRAMQSDAVANKWHVFQYIREARTMLGASDRSLAILNALLSFHRETELTAKGTLVVWPSNEQLSARANGMSATTLRRHLSVLIECGLIIRRDSPNGKRYARKRRDGQIEQAFGFDLSPILTRAEEFKELAEAIQAHKKAFRIAKERLTLLRRDTLKLIEVGNEEAVPGNWSHIRNAYQTIILQLPRKPSKQVVDEICVKLQTLYNQVRDSLETFIKTRKTTANESRSGCHIQNPKPNPINESEQDAGRDTDNSVNLNKADAPKNVPERELSLGVVMKACSNLRELSQNGDIRHWRDLFDTAELARPMLAVDSPTWNHAKQIMGEQHATITLAAMYQRADRINNPSGYLRSLTDKAQHGKFSTWPMVMALLNANTKSLKLERDTRQSFDKTDQAPIEVSDALLRSLQKLKRP